MVRPGRARQVSWRKKPYSRSRLRSMVGVAEYCLVFSSNTSCLEMDETRPVRMEYSDCASACWVLEDRAMFAELNTLETMGSPAAAPKVMLGMVSVLAICCQALIWVNDPPKEI